MTVALSDMTTARQECEATVTSINRSYAALQLRYDTTVENYMQQLTGKNRDLSKAHQALQQRSRQLADKQRDLKAKEDQLLSQQRDLQQREEQMLQNQRAIGQALEAKQRELEQLKGAVASALVGYKDKGLNVETKDGKVYVSMEDKLLFASGSWTVSPKGIGALKTLARILEDNPDLTIMVEGHTDNDPFRGTAAVKDNWDLSVMRATAIVKQLLRQGPAINPARVVAAGHAEYTPKVKNTTAANKARNRRTEIILTPRLGEVMKLVE
jgi:chemotaxis protein MotB